MVEPSPQTVVILVSTDMEEYGEYVLDEGFDLEYEMQQELVQQQRHEQQKLQQQQMMAQQQHHQQQAQQQQRLKSFYENKAAQDEKKILELDAQYRNVMEKYQASCKEIEILKSRKVKQEAGDDSGAREKIKQLEDRVTLIKTKAKERIDENDATIKELNGKIKNYEEMLAMLEVNCKEAVVKFNDFQQELARKEEIIQRHYAFKNQFDYTVNYLTEKCQFITDQYEKKIKLLEEKLKSQNNSSSTGSEGKDTEPEMKTPAAPHSESVPAPPSTDTSGDLNNILENSDENEKTKAGSDILSEALTLSEAIEELESTESEAMDAQ